MKIAAIDIGSNAVRLLIKDTQAYQTAFAGQPQATKQTIQQSFLDSLDNIGPSDYYERQPLKSGMDVFESGKIQPATALRLTAIISRFAAKMKEMGVEHYRACATAAYRDAANGREVANQISIATGIKIEVISGDEEACLTRSSLVLPPQCAEQTAVISDVGGGSTELSVILNGNTLFSHSYRIGSMRYLCHQQDPQEENLIDQQCEQINRDHGRVHYFGVGGCVKFMCSYINGLNKVQSAKEEETNAQSADAISPVAPLEEEFYPGRTISVRQMEEIYADLKTRTVDSIIDYYHLPRERADILTPACSIYLRIAHCLKTDTIIVPSIGVRNGIVTQIYRHYAK